MALVAPVVDGKIQDASASAQSLSASKESSGNSSLDKDAFLQLLVAQMKYQDPLEPTSNTEYISQFATFSELEQMQNMSATMELQRATSLVGKNVIMQVTSKNGSSSYVTGPVDYVEFENSKAYLSIKGNLYSMDDLVTVVEDGYQDAFDKTNNLLTDLYNLPTVSALTIDDMEAVLKIKTTYNEMTDYEKSFLTEDETTLLNKYFDRMKEIMAAAGVEEPEEKKQLTVEEMLEALLGKMDALVEGVGNISISDGSSGSSGGSSVTETVDKTEETGKTEETDKTGETDETDKTEESGAAEESGSTDKTEDGGSSDKTEDSSSSDSSSSDSSDSSGDSSSDAT